MAIDGEGVLRILVSEQAETFWGKGEVLHYCITRYEVYRYESGS